MLTICTIVLNKLFEINFGHKGIYIPQKFSNTTEFLLGNSTKLPDILTSIRYYVVKI